MYDLFMICMLLHIQVGLILHVIPKRTSGELEGRSRIWSLFRGEHLEHAC